MKFDIEKVHFYRAVNLFEEKKYQEAFELFYECAKHGNLIAPFYIQYMADPANNIGLKLNQIKKLEIAKMLEYIPKIPTVCRPDKWLEASLCILELKHQKTIKKPNQLLIREIKQKLNVLGKSVANARIKLKFENALINSKKAIRYNSSMTAIQPESEVASFHANLYGLFYQKENHNISWIDLELSLVEKHAKLAYDLKTSGKLEKILAEHNYVLIEDKAILKKDDARAIGSSAFFLQREQHWILNSAYMGNPISQHIISMQKVEPFKTESNLWVLMAALNGHAVAQIQMGILYHSGADPRFPVNLNKAREMLEKALAQEIPKELERLSAEAYAILGVMHGNGEAGLEKSVNKAIEYSKIAANIGHPSAFRNLGGFYEIGSDQLARNYKLAAQNYEDYLKKLPNDEIILFSLGRLYERGGFGIEIDLTKAAHNFKKAAGKNVDAMAHYGRLLYLGMGITKNESDGLKLLIHAAKKQSSCAAQFVWELFSDGSIENLQAVNLTENDIHHFFTLSNSRDTNNLHTLTNYALALYYGIDINPNKEEGLQLLALAASKKALYAMHQLIVLYADNAILNPKKFGLTENVIDEYLNQIKKNIANNKKMISQIGWVYLKLKQYKNAHDLFLLGIAEKQRESYTGIGQLYEKGYSEGNFVLKPDQKTAYEYYSQAALLGCPMSIIKQAYYLLDGKDIKDVQKAKTLLEESLNGSLAKSMGPWWLNQASKLMIQGNLQAF